MLSPSFSLRSWGRWSLIAAVMLLQACATVANPDRRDPMEALNRNIFGFNDAVDMVLLKPVATIYRETTPS